MVLSVLVSSTATTATLSAEIKHISQAVAKLDSKLDKMDERVRQTEIKQASYLAAN
jgi:hypothetical protein